MAINYYPFEIRGTFSGVWPSWSSDVSSAIGESILSLGGDDEQLLIFLFVVVGTLEVHVSL